ncbi:hypothetical protein Enr17x_36310 [Gimesia fumaroli]|uniref:Uncharacterized protein n=1 Tax=Gimesia fumaroli TaxID=2527976 RepID=A0A518IER5_9PLAN|nr:hypothetical protein Enr17x_36310 [Gimesia fumaroli]
MSIKGVFFGDQLKYQDGRCYEITHRRLHNMRHYECSIYFKSRCVSNCD